MTAWPVGIGAALGVIGIALALPLRLRLPLFALLLSGAAGVYAGAALGPAPGWEAAVESAAFLVFTGAALVGLSRPRVLAAAWALHAVFDLVHHLGLVPIALVSWYPVACAICDLAWAAFVWAGLMLSSGGGAPRPA
jgi:hypothetical protein